MIDLFSVKLNGQYDDIGAEPTIENGLFLCDTTGNDYIKGYSYQITTSNGETNAERVEAVTDYRINQAILPLIQNTCEWLNNWFVLRFNYRNNYAYGEYGASGAYHEMPQIPTTGDLCKIRVTDNWDIPSLYNTYFASYVTVTENGITGNSPLYKNGEMYFYYIMRLPLDVERAISSMIYFDIFERGTVSELKSESVGNYSYTKEDVFIGALAYPKELISGLEACYKKVRFIQ